MWQQLSSLWFASSFGGYFHEWGIGTIVIASHQINAPRRRQLRSFGGACCSCLAQPKKGQALLLNHELQAIVEWMLFGLRLN